MKMTLKSLSEGLGEVGWCGPWKRTDTLIVNRDCGRFGVGHRLVFSLFQIRRWPRDFIHSLSSDTSWYLKVRRQRFQLASGLFIKFEFDGDGDSLMGTTTMDISTKKDTALRGTSTTTNLPGDALNFGFSV